MKYLLLILVTALSFSCTKKSDSTSGDLPDNVWAPIGFIPGSTENVIHTGDYIEKTYYHKGTKRVQLVTEVNGRRLYSKVFIEKLDSYPKGIKEGVRTYDYHKQ